MFHNRPYLKKFVIITALVLVSCLVSCIGLKTGRFTIIDTGGAIAAIGQQKANLRKEPLPAGKETLGYNKDLDYHYRVWKKGENYIVSIPVAYAPARYSVFEHHCGHGHRQRPHTLQTTLPRERYTDEELMDYPLEHIYAEISEQRYRSLLKQRKFRTHLIPDDTLRDESVLNGAELVLDIHGKEAGAPSPMHPDLTGTVDPDRLPRRRAWYNQCLRPISWVAEVVDIPLSLIATPIGWVADAIYEPLAN